MISASLENRRILVIDDNHLIHDDFRKILAPATADALAAINSEEAALFGEEIKEAPRPHFDISSAYQGEEGIEMVQEAVAKGLPYAMAFVDVRMPPGLDGVETTRRILRIDPRIQIVICTAYADYSWDEMFARLGHHDGLLILKKPFDSVEVLQMAYSSTRKWWLHQVSQEKMEDLERRVRERTSDLQRAKEFAENLIQGADVMFVQVDAEGRGMKTNRFTERMIGYSAKEIEGVDCLKLLIAPEEYASVYDRFRRFKEGRLTSDLIEASILTRDGQRRQVIWRVSGLREGDEFAGTFAFGLDITERKRLQTQLFQSQKLETVGRLAGGIAHEFNSLLTGILGQAELLLADLPEESPLASGVLGIQQGGERAVKLIRQLLAYGQRQALRVEPINLNRVVEGVREIIVPLIGENVEVIMKLEENLYPVRADAGQIEQVIFNLVVNARDAMPDGGELRVETRNVSMAQGEAGGELDLAPGDYVVLSLSDSGTGMTEDVKARVFEPFFTTKGVGRGTGLGLSTCYGIIKQSGGHLTVDSKPGDGTVFEMYLPGWRQSPAEVS